MATFDRFDAEALRGRWHDVLSSLGVPESFLSKKHGPCPFCGGTDRFRFTDSGGDGLWVCNQCGGGNGTSLAMRYLKLSFVEFKDRVRELAGTARVRVENKPSRKELLKERKALWDRGKPVADGGPVGKYLISRLGQRVQSTELRSVLTDDGAMMLARYLAPGQTNGLESVHRTYLTKDGRKIEGDKCRKLMRGETVKGGAIRLMPTTNGTLGLAEGIETALAAWLLFGVPTWATISEGFLRKCEVPDHVTRVFIFGDRDASFTGQAAAYECANRLAIKGKNVEVKIPDVAPGMDWNDVLRSRQSRAAALRSI